jgi:hypothetical protein
MVFNATFNNMTAISWQFVHKGDVITVNACFFLHRYMSKYRVMTLFILQIKSYVPDYSVIPPHTGLCPLLQCYPHINSYVANCSVKLHTQGYVPYSGVIPT